ncbi:serine hydrolase [Taklimakanibacter lacteus]|uniref:serine hydrolase n=1 Tax=Taklimakanibacter lacteus TaxID=2268456 RepID=UPI000E66E27B
MMFVTAFRHLMLSLALLLAAAVGTPETALAKAKFSALAVDARTGDILFASNPDGLRHPASLTKVMTLYILFQELKAGRLTLASRITVSRYAAGRPPTKLGVGAGKTVSVEEAIKALITLSANDIAVAVGENIAGSETAFAQRMTNTARSLGMSRTTFRNASGLPDPRQVTTARDMATLSLRVQRDFPQYYPYFRTTSFKFGKRMIRTHNRLLGRFEGTDGIKTGYIRASGFNLTTSARRGDKRIIGVVMGGRTGRARDNYMIAMLSKAFPKCKSGSTLANAIEGTVPRASEAEVKVAAAEETDVEAVAKRSKKRRTGRAADQMPEPEGDTGGYDNEQMAEQAQNASNSLPGTTFAAVSEDASVAPDQADLARVSGEVANPDTQPEQKIAAVAPVEAGMPSDLPFKVKKPGDTQGGQVVVPSVQSSWNIQIGAYPSKKSAQDALYKARKVNSKLFAEKQAYTVEVKKGEETIFRARMSGFTAKSAKTACRTLKRKGVDCATLAPQS